MTLGADEFIRRFLLHVLPDGFHRIRHYGYLANGGRAAKLADCRRLVAVPEPATPAPAADYRKRYQQLTGRSLDLCPCCGGRMIENRHHPPCEQFRRCGSLEHLMIPMQAPQPSVPDRRQRSTPPRRYRISASGDGGYPENHPSNRAARQRHSSVYVPRPPQHPVRQLTDARHKPVPLLSSDHR